MATSADPGEGWRTGGGTVTFHHRYERERLPFNAWLRDVEAELQHRLGDLPVSAVQDRVKIAEKNGTEADFRGYVEATLVSLDEALGSKTGKTVSQREKDTATRAALWLYQCAKAVEQGMPAHAFIVMFAELVNGVMDAAEVDRLGHADRTVSMPASVRSVVEQRDGARKGAWIASGKTEETREKDLADIIADVRANIERGCSYTIATDTVAERHSVTGRAIRKRLAPRGGKRLFG